MNAPTPIIKSNIMIEKQQTPLRGYIIIDACVLLYIFHTLPENNLHKSWVQTKIFDALSLLAQGGYKIFVPEMVSLEISNALRNGQDLGEFFDRRVSYNQAYTNLLLEAKRKGILELSAPPVIDRSQSAVYIKNLHAIISNKNIPIETKRSRLVKLLRTNKKGFGDDACYYLSDYLKKDGTPTFVLSNDRALLGRLHFNKVSAITLRGFLFSLSRHAVLDAINVKTPAGLLCADLTDIQSACGTESGIMMPAYHGDEEKFATSLKEIMERPAPQAVQRFTQRYGNISLSAARP